MKGGEHAVLLVHGLTGSPFEMKYLARQLNRAGFTVEGPCLAGHGATLADLKRTRWQDWYATVQDSFNALKRNHATVSIAGLCMGALLALKLSADQKDDVNAIALISTTLFYDGWSLPWYKFLLPLAYFTPACHLYSFTEQEPYGIKNKALRTRVVEGMREGSIAHEQVPGVSMRELYRLMDTTRKRVLSRATAPTLILHSLDDDLASVENALYVRDHIASRDVRTVLFDDSYHMIPIDNERAKAAHEIARFFCERSAAKTGLRHPELHRGTPYGSPLNTAIMSRK